MYIIDASLIEVKGKKQRKRKRQQKSETLKDCRFPELYCCRSKNCVALLNAVYVNAVANKKLE